MFPLNLSLNRRHESKHLTISCPLEKCSFEGKTQYISPSDLCMEVPTTQIKVTLLKLLNQDVTVETGNVTVTGTVKGYTIEMDRYLIGILISKPDRATWKRFVAESPRPSFLTEIRHVSP
jgi:hypothetical protein